MVLSNEPDTNTGNGDGKTPIQASAQPSTAAKSQPSPKSTSIGEGSTKPVSLPEALSLLQTLCLDLRSLKSEVAILARNKRIYIVIAVPPDTGNLSVSDTGHILIDGQPVSKL
jgi:hypothetical protein